VRRQVRCLLLRQRQRRCAIDIVIEGNNKDGVSLDTRDIANDGDWGYGQIDTVQGFGSRQQQGQEDSVSAHVLSGPHRPRPEQ
jgi:hypothetical protein